MENTIFRVFDPLAKKMFNNDEICLLPKLDKMQVFHLLDIKHEFGHPAINFGPIQPAISYIGTLPDIVLMNYIGYPDIRDVKIFKYDVVEFSTGMKFVIDYSRGSYVLRPIDKTLDEIDFREDCVCEYIYKDGKLQATIIGNIYEGY